MTHRPPPPPPRLAEALLRATLPDGVVGDSILRDLREEHALRGGGRSWYWREALLLAAHYAFLHRSEPSPMDRLVQDLRYALRRLARNPGFAAVALVTMALGIGANVAIYSVVKAVLLDPLPYRAPGELVAVFETKLPARDGTNVTNPGNWRDWRERAASFEDMAAITLAQPASLSGGTGEPVEVVARYTSGNWFPLLGLEPSLGGWPEVVPEQEGQPQAVLAHRFWRAHFGGDPTVVGRTIAINGVPAVVVGVAPPEYVVFGDDADLFAAIPLRGDQTTTGRYLNVVGRLAAGVDIHAARDEMLAVHAGLEEEYPQFNGDWSVNLVPLQEEVVGDVRAGLWVLLGAVGLLLLIACANLANLFLARATERRREMAVRTSLGAGRGRLAAQLLVESLVVAGLGAVLGCGLAWLGTDALARLAPSAFALPRVEGAGIDGGVVLFAVALTVVTGLLFGLVPAIHAAAVRPARTLNAEGRGPGRGSGRMRSALVVVEVALSVVLLAGAGLLARSFVELMSVDPGIRAADVVTARVAVQSAEYAGTEPDVLFFGELMDRVRAMPGVEAAGGISFLPFSGSGSSHSFHPADRPTPPVHEWAPAHVRNVAGDWFDAAGTTLLRGRVFTDGDRAGSPPVVVVTRTLAEAQWPGEDPIGKRILFEWVEPVELEVVGVVEDVLHDGLDQEPAPTLYLPYAQAPYFPYLVVTVRSTLPPAEVAAGIEAAVHAIDPDVPVARARTMTEVIDGSVARPRVTAFLMGAFAALAALLATVGLYGVLSYAVSLRVREIGVRVALGAEPGRVLGLVVRQGMLLVVAGVGAGLLVTLLLGPVVESLLFRVPAADPTSLAAAAALLLGVGLAACVVPARRATRVAPSEALRAE